MSFNIEAVRRGMYTGLELIDPESGQSFQGAVCVQVVGRRGRYGKDANIREGVSVRIRGPYVHEAVVVFCSAYVSRQHNFEVASRLALTNKKLHQEHLQQHPGNDDAELKELSESQEASLALTPRYDYTWSGHYTAIARFHELKLIKSGHMGEFALTERGRRIADWLYKGVMLARVELERPDDVPEDLRRE